MMKEIMEQWQTVSRQAKSTGADLGNFVLELERRGNLLLTGAGGAYYTCLQIAWLLREVTGLKALAVPAYEIESLEALYGQGDFVLAVSQSGETADTISAVERAESRGMRVASLVNMPMSTLARMSEFSFANHSGPEICVLSTKSATAQITFGYLLAKRLKGQDGGAAIDQLSHVLSQYLTRTVSWKIREVTKRLVSAHSIFVLGRGLFLPCAMIAALNIKEASYSHAEAFAAGELKHGVLALIEKGVPVMLYVDRDDSYMLNVASEVKSRGAHLVGIAYEDNELFDDFVPMPIVSDPLLAAICGLIPGQLIAYHLGIQAGVNPDRPRNLAKSVTVQ
jgi:glucosamine--fructose-6-phosphate aminotransferase (isomerizing)